MAPGGQNGSPGMSMGLCRTPLLHLPTSLELPLFVGLVLGARRGWWWWGSRCPWCPGVAFVCWLHASAGPGPGAALAPQHSLGWPRGRATVFGGANPLGGASALVFV